MVSLNQRDVYPEYPLKPPKPKSQKAPNIWVPWHHDLHEDRFKSFNIDM